MRYIYMYIYVEGIFTQPITQSMSYGLLQPKLTLSHIIFDSDFGCRAPCRLLLFLHTIFFSHFLQPFQQNCHLHAIGCRGFQLKIWVKCVRLLIISIYYRGHKMWTNNSSVYSVPNDPRTTQRQAKSGGRRRRRTKRHEKRKKSGSHNHFGQIGVVVLKCLCNRPNET